MATVLPPLLPPSPYADWMSAGPYPAGVAAALRLPLLCACVVAAVIRCPAATAAESVLRRAEQAAWPLEAVAHARVVVIVEVVAETPAAWAVVAETVDVRAVVVSVITPAAASRSRR